MAESNAFGNHKFDEIDQLKKKLDSFRPFDKVVLDKLKEFIRIDEVYNSNAIEGNKLTLRETKVVLLHKVTVGGKTVKDHLEALNLSNAIDYLEDIVAKRIPLSERVVQDLHYIVLDNISEYKGKIGIYRSVPVTISGSKHFPPQPYRVQKDMEDLFIWYQENENVLHPIELAAEFHHRLAYIHPFIDGNGRTSRLCMNFILMSKGFLPVIIEVEDREEYYEALENASINHDCSQFIELVKRCEEKSLNTYLTHLVPYDQL